MTHKITVGDFEDPYENKVILASSTGRSSNKRLELVATITPHETVCVYRITDHGVVVDEVATFFEAVMVYNGIK